ncbi:hypothetical protein [Mycoplana rhizolycopersici]|uniref:Uncharacterized protein n=1 Tax=Mycoplana rhizolycopersici TaxID=2746702 RepID=A0ABX2Q9A3_9HYPH|nr:hypothetical protein [Rhizobium rhizolycopersici]NVP54305.1 hypothetical protein [Rhizobium rhizolycopersici]
MPSLSDRIRLLRGSVFAVSLSLAVAGVFGTNAFALSELQQIPGQPPQQEQSEQPASEQPPAEAEPDSEQSEPLQLPMPDPLIRRDSATKDTAEPPEEDQATQPETPVEVLYDIEKVPEPVRRMRELIVEAAASGDIERLRPLLGKGPTQTQVSVVDGDSDPVTTLRGLSGDSEGVEILAILLDVLATGFVRVDAGTPNETYVWPYFVEKSLDTLSPPEKVELLRIVTAGDFADMQEFGGYNFYRAGISPDGQWKFFVAGD